MMFSAENVSWATSGAYGGEFKEVSLQTNMSPVLWILEKKGAPPIEGFKLQGRHSWYSL